MNKTIKTLMITFLISFSDSEAHPGHGHSDHHGLAHYIFSTEHLAEATALLAVLALAAFIVRYAFSDKKRNKINLPD